MKDLIQRARWLFAVNERERLLLAGMVAVLLLGLGMKAWHVRQTDLKDQRTHRGLHHE